MNKTRLTDISSKVNSITKVMIVEDSKVKQGLLTHILESDSSISVIAVASSGEEALSKLNKYKPDIITMDIELPGINGFIAAEEIVFNYSIPVIIITSAKNKFTKEQISQKMKESGSLYLLDTPPSPCSKDYEAQAKKIIKMVKLLSKVKMVTRHRKKTNKKNNKEPRLNNDKLKSIPSPPSNDQNIKLIAVGVSTGGPTLLQKILSSLPKNYPIPILIVQHISNEFDSTLVNYLNNFCKVHVKLAENGEIIKPSTIYFAPGDQDMILSKKNMLQVKKLENGKILHPSVSSFFTSVLKFYKENVLAVILTGMGEDGALELKKLRNAGALTVTQESNSCAVFGMPRAAIKIEAAEKVLNPQEIIKLILSLPDNKSVLH